MPKTVSLDQLASAVSLRKQLLSERVADELLKLFGMSVKSTVALTAALAAVDYFFIAMKYMPSADRLITENVLMSIIGATIVQLGAVVAGIVFALFKQPPAEPDVDSSDDSQPTSA